MQNYPTLFLGVLWFSSCTDSHCSRWLWHHLHCHGYNIFQRKMLSSEMLVVTFTASYFSRLQ